MSEAVQELIIRRLAPGEGRVLVEFAATGVAQAAELSLEIRQRGSWDIPRRVRIAPGAATVDVGGLVDATDYELRLVARQRNGDGRAGTSPSVTSVTTEPGASSQPGAVLAASATRLVRPGHVPGVVVNYIHPEDYTYNFSGRSPASPSIAELPNGDFVASHDVFWGGHGQNLSFVFRSTDRGETWSYLSELNPCFWGKLFVHRGALYMLATTTEYGALVIRRSSDGGATWSDPTEILPAGDRKEGGPHKAPMPVVSHHGRLWSAVEHGSWMKGSHDAGVVSVPVDADLLDAASWTATPFLPYDPTWPGAIKGGEKPGVLEGNVVVTPSGVLVNILRYNTIGGSPAYGKAIVLDVDAERPKAPLRFRQVIDFPGNMSKFTIQFDAVSNRYWALVNPVTGENVKQRNVLSLAASEDLVHWERVHDVLNYEENGWHEDSHQVGFQYVDWMFDGDDIIAASRTAINGAWNYHNANYLTIHRIKDFRSIHRTGDFHSIRR